MTFMEFLTDCPIVTIEDITNKIILRDNEISLRVSGGDFCNVVSDIQHIDCRQLAINQTGKSRGKTYEAMFKRFDRLRDIFKQLVLDYIFELRAIAFDAGICEDE